METSSIRDIEATKPSLAGATSSVGARAVIAGAIVTLSLQLLFIALGSAIGLSVGRPSERAEGLAIGMVIWTLITIAVSGFIGGWVASVAARSLARLDGMLNGFVTWAVVALLASFAVGNLVGRAIGAAYGMRAPEDPQQLARHATSAAGLSMWFFFLLLALPLFTSLLGGAFGARGLVRRLGVPRERRAPATPPLPSPV